MTSRDRLQPAKSPAIVTPAVEPLPPASLVRRLTPDPPYANAGR